MGGSRRVGGVGSTLAVSVRHSNALSPSLFGGGTRDGCPVKGRPLPCLKKHVCVFAARPGTALIIAAYADKHWSGECDAVLVLSAATKKGKLAIQDAFPKIPFDEAGKPTLLISTTGTTGTGVDSLQRANHASSQPDLAQLRGRPGSAGRGRESRVSRVVDNVSCEPRCFLCHFYFSVFSLSERFAPSWLDGQDVERDGAKDICRHFLLRGFVCGRGGAWVGVWMPRGK